MSARYSSAWKSVPCAAIPKRDASPRRICRGAAANGGQFDVHALLAQPPDLADVAFGHIAGPKECEFQSRHGFKSERAGTGLARQPLR